MWGILNLLGKQGKSQNVLVKDKLDIEDKLVLLNILDK